MKQKFGYVDGVVLAVPRKNLAKYKKMAKLGAKVWMDHGALSYAETIGDDVKPGKVTSFPQSVKLKKGEIVVFCWMTYKSRRHRDQVFKKVMADPRLSEEKLGKMPFDGMRMFWGGFKSFVQS